MNNDEKKDQDKGAEGPAKSTAEGRAKAFKWFGTLGYQDTKGLKFVRVATGKCMDSLHCDSLLAKNARISKLYVLTGIWHFSYRCSLHIWKRANGELAYEKANLGSLSEYPEEVDRLSLCRSPEKRTFEKVAVSVLRSPLVQQGARPSEVPHQGENDQDGPAYENENAFHFVHLLRRQ